MEEKTVQILKQKLDEKGQTILQVSNDLIHYLSNIKEEIILVSVISNRSDENIQTIERLIGKQITLQADRTFCNLRLLTCQVDDKILYLLSFPLDQCFEQNNNEESSLRVVILSLVYMLSTLSILVVSNQEDLQQIAQLHERLMFNLNNGNMCQQTLNKFQKMQPNLVLLAQGFNQEIIQVNTDPFYSFLKKNLNEKQSVLFVELFRKRFLIFGSVSYDDLRQKLNTVHCVIKPKKIRSLKQTGQILLELILNFTDNFNINRNAIELDCYNKLEESWLRRKVDEVLGELERKFNDLKEPYLCDDKILMDDEMLVFNFRDLQKDILVYFDELTKTFNNSTRVIQYREKLIDKLQTIFELLSQQNYEQSREFCSELMTNYVQIFKEQDSNIDMINSSDIYIKERSGGFEEILKSYFDDAKGPFKYKTVADNIPSLLFEIFDEWFDKLNDYYRNQLNSNKGKLLQAQDQVVILQERLKESEAKRNQSENQNLGLSYDLENFKREILRVTQQKETLEEMHEQRIADYKRKYEKQREKKKRLKGKCEQQTIELRNMNQELYEKKKELISCLQQIDERDKALDQLFQRNQKANSLDGMGGLQTELLSLMKQFKTNIVNAEDQLRRQRESLSLDSSRTSISTDWGQRRLIESLEKQVQKLEERNKQLEDKNYQIQDEKEEIERRYQEVEKEKLIIQNKLTILSLESKDKDKETKSIAEDLKNDEKDALSQVSKQQADFLNVMTVHKQQIETLNKKLDELQDRFYEKTAENTDLKTKQNNILTILREGIKLTQKKKNNLPSILVTMDPIIQQEIKDIFQQGGIKL